MATKKAKKTSQDRYNDKVEMMKSLPKSRRGKTKKVGIPT
jgi:hypothetical protein